MHLESPAVDADDFPTYLNLRMMTVAPAAGLCRRRNDNTDEALRRLAPAVKSDWLMTLMQQTRTQRSNQVIRTVLFALVSDRGAEGIRTPTDWNLNRLHSIAAEVTWEDATPRGSIRSLRGTSGGMFAPNPTNSP
jgi:hypothetical protein